MEQIHVPHERQEAKFDKARTASVFFRPFLRISAQGFAVPDSLFDSWLFLLEELRESLITPEEFPDEQYIDEVFRLLAVRGRFERISPQWTLSENLRKMLDWTETLEKRLSQKNYEKALSFFHVESWCEAVDSFYEDWMEDRFNESETVQEAVELLNDVDDFGIIIASAAERFGDRIDLSSLWERYHEMIDRVLQPRNEFLLINASAWIQAMASTFEDALPERHLELAATTYPFAVFLDRLEEFEHDFYGTEQGFTAMADRVQRIVSQKSY